MNRTLKAPRLMLPSDLVIRKMEDSINQHNCNRSRGGGAAVWMYEIQHEVAFLIRSGGNIRRDEVMDHDVCRPDIRRPDIRRPVGYDLVVYNIESGELRIRAELVGERCFYCQLFGEQLFGDRDFFEHGEVFNLDAIYDRGEDVQSTASIPGLKNIVLFEVQEVLAGQKTLHITLKSEAIFDALREYKRSLSHRGRILCAKFRITLDVGVDITVTIYSENKIRFSRPLGIPAIDLWLIHHGIRVSPHATLQLTAPSALASSLANPKPKGTKVSVAS